MSVQSILADFVKETTTTQGTAPKVLAGAAPGCVAFGDPNAFADGALVGYSEQQLTLDANGIVIDASREVGLATYDATAGTLTPTLILSSTNGGSAVNWGPGTKDIFCGPPAALIPMMTAALTSGKGGRPLRVNAASNAFEIGAPMLGQQAATTLTIAGGAVTATQAFHTIDTEAAAASDDLSTIVTTNIADGGLLLIVAADTAHTVNAKHAPSPGAGEIYLLSGADFALDDDAKSLLLHRRGNHWIEVGRSGGLSLGLSSDLGFDSTGKLAVKKSYLGHVADFSFVDTDRGLQHRADAAAKTWTLLPVATAGDGWYIDFEDAYGGTVLSSAGANIYVNGSTTGVASYTLTKGESGRLFCKGGTVYIVDTNKPPTSIIQGGFKNLKISTPDGGTTATVTADQVTVENTAGQSLRLSGINVAVDFTGTGAGKLDAGSIASATWYYLWAITKPDGTASVIGSTSSTNPTLPTGYTFKARLGAVRTKTGSAVFRGTLQYGRKVQYLNAGTGLPAIITGTSGTPATPSYTSVSISALVPPTASEINSIVHSHGSAVLLAPNNSYGNPASSTNPPPFAVGVGGYDLSQCGWMMVESTNVYYASADASGGAWCMGWEDNL